ncbi:MAG: mannose-1-phosphate guanylyltransferase [Bacteroidales bacterium]|nr:mannose-1-phosphate guanylyltransferase [Bacteroidales bacterium]
MNASNYCVIMAGGIGARFWPMSRTTHPKQFIDILGTGETLIQQTYQRFLRICPPENIYVVTNARYADLVKEQLPDMAENQILLEPAGRNTAPCIAYAVYKIAGIDPEANIIVAPSDHIILKENIFVDVIFNALEATRRNDWLLTLGIQPSRPDTGYGYIQFVDKEVYPDDKRIKKVKTFTEKPNLELARTFVESGDFLWNAGIFIWSLKSITAALEKYLPDVSQVFKEGMDKYNTDLEKSFIENAYAICKSISIDYGVMEKASNVYTLSSDFGWSDLGTWGSLYAIRSKDGQGNAIMGQNVMTYNTMNCIVNMPDDKLVVINGLDNCIVVEKAGVLLICDKEREQELRAVVKNIETTKGEKYI